MTDTLIVNTAQAEPLLDGAGIGGTSRVLDVGCGNGKLTRLAARRARRGQVTGLDLSGPMLARARARAAEEGIGNVTFEQGDAQVYPLAPGGFDVAVSRFGVMFSGDPAAANIARGLRPGGRLAFACLPDLSGTDLWPVFGAAAAHLPPAPPPATGTTSPESLADPERAREVLTRDGFTGVRELTDPDHPVTVTHWLAVSSRKQPGSPAKPA